MYMCVCWGEGNALAYSQILCSEYLIVKNALDFYPFCKLDQKNVLKDFAEGKSALVLSKTN